MDPNTTNQNQPVIGGENKPKGPLVAGLIVVVILLILAIYYMWGDILMPGKEVPGGDTTTQLNTSETAAVSKSDEVTAIEEDLTAGVIVDVDLSDLDTIK